MTTIFTQVLDDQSDVLQVPDPGVRVPKPKTLGILPDECGSALDELSRRRCGRRRFLQDTGRPIHAGNLPTPGREGKTGIRLCASDQGLDRRFLAPPETDRPPRITSVSRHRSGAMRIIVEVTANGSM
jgi:hypothetical protein